jgi:hypothetical protein
MLLPAFKAYKGNLPKKVAVGMISHRRLQVETPDEVARTSSAASWARRRRTSAPQIPPLRWTFRRPRPRR